MTFETAWYKTMSWEGGSRLHNVAGDPGGLTKYGISQRAHPDLDIPGLTAEEARDIAQSEYWIGPKVYLLPDSLRWDVFDFGFNAGPNKSVRTLQYAMNLISGPYGHTVSEDGVLGSQTINRLAAMGKPEVLLAFRAVRMDHYVLLAETGQTKFLAGWLRRANGDFNG